MTHVHEDIGAYVLGALEEDDTRRVAAHLRGCSECAAAHAELARLPALLDLSVATGASGRPVIDASGGQDAAPLASLSRCTT